MTALYDIRAAAAEAPPVPAGFDRMLFLGVSAERAVAAEIKPIPERLCGMDWSITTEFEGWSIRQIGPAGVWEDVA